MKTQKLKIIKAFLAIIYTITFTVIFTLTGSAQEEDIDLQFEGSVKVFSGIQYLEVKNLNSILSENSIPTVAKVHYIYGFGGQLVFDRWIIGGEGYESSSSHNTNNIKTTTNGDGGYFYVGYKLLDKPIFYIAPRIGFGGSELNVQINNNTEENLENILLLGNSSNIDISHGLLHSGLNIGIALGTSMAVNFDLGYNYNFDNKWEVEKGKIENSVKDNTSSLFLQTSLVYKFNRK